MALCAPRCFQQSHWVLMLGLRIFVCRQLVRVVCCFGVVWLEGGGVNNSSVCVAFKAYWTLSEGCSLCAAQAVLVASTWSSGNSIKAI